MQEIPKKISVVKEKFVENFFNAILYNNGIIEITWDTAITQIEVAHLAKVQEIVAEFGGGKKMPLYFSIHEFLGISKEARQYATSREGVTYTLATTVIVDNLAKKLLLNFFMKINKPLVPTRGFTNKEDCFLWLEKIAKENNLKLEFQ